MMLQEIIVNSPLAEHMVPEVSKDAITIENVSKLFETSHAQLPFRKQKAEAREDAVRAVDHVSLTIKRREIVGILGANGSGKSTLIRMLSTLLIPDAGHLSIFGYDVVKDEMMVRRMINRVSVEAAFFKKLSPFENLMYTARLYHLPVAEAREKIKRILKRLGIKEEQMKAPMEAMSRGMQQKVAIARAFLTAPIVLLLDEPTTGLDPRSRIDVQDFVKELREQHNATILITTHDMDEADALCDRVAIIEKGKLVALGETQALKQEVARLRKHKKPVSMNEVFLHYTMAHLITDEEIKQYGSWEKAFEVKDAQHQED